jgi:hypothetical protein
MGRTSYPVGIAVAVAGLIAASAVAGPLATPDLSRAAQPGETEGQPVQFEARIFYPPTTPAIHVVTAYEVPDGKRLVVEHVSGSVILGAQTRLRVRLNGHFLPFQLDPHAAGQTVQRATASEDMTFVVDDRGPNAQELKLEVLREGSSLPYIVNHLVVVSGYLYDLVSK